MNADALATAANVYHAINMWHGFGPAPEWPRDYKFVAAIPTSDVEEAFDLTNHVHGAWQDNPAIFVHENGRNARSTSMGDVVATLEGVYRCEAVGWTKIA
jgi:hypothetical protein